MSQPLRVAGFEVITSGRFWVITKVQSYLDQQLIEGRAYFSNEEAMKSLGISPSAFAAAARRLLKKRKLVNARHEFYLILRPEDRSWRLA